MNAQPDLNHTDCELPIDTCDRLLIEVDIDLVGNRMYQQIS
jgi:hypothetical protein